MLTQEGRAARKVADESRAAAARDRVYGMLTLGPAKNFELTAREVGGTEGLRRLRELRQQGVPIKKRHVGLGVWEYFLDPGGRL